MIDVKCYYENGDTTGSGINATFEEAKKYYVGQYFNIGFHYKDSTCTEVEDNMQKCIRIELA